jgi:hypothetical protein
MLVVSLLSAGAPKLMANLTDYEKAGFNSLLPKVTKALSGIKKETPPPPKNAGLTLAVPPQNPDGIIKQDAFWPTWSNFFRDGVCLFISLSAPIQPAEERNHEGYHNRRDWHLGVRLTRYQVSTQRHLGVSSESPGAWKGQSSEALIVVIWY